MRRFKDPKVCHGTVGITAESEHQGVMEQLGVLTMTVTHVLTAVTESVSEGNCGMSLEHLGPWASDFLKGIFRPEEKKEIQ